MMYHSTPKKVYFHIKFNMYIFTTLFVTALNFKQSRILSSREWINKLLSIYTMEYYSAVERNRLLWFMLEHAWMSKTLCLLRKAQCWRPHILSLWFHEMSRKGKSTETENQLVVAGWAWANGHERSLLAWWKCLKTELW